MAQTLNGYSVSTTIGGANSSSTFLPNHFKPINTKAKINKIKIMMKSEKNTYPAVESELNQFLVISYLDGSFHG